MREIHARVIAPSSWGTEVSGLRFEIYYPGVSLLAGSECPLAWGVGPRSASLPNCWLCMLSCGCLLPPTCSVLCVPACVFARVCIFACACAHPPARRRGRGVGKEGGWPGCRGFIRGDAGLKGEFATRICGSADLYQVNQRYATRASSAPPLRSLLVRVHPLAHAVSHIPGVDMATWPPLLVLIPCSRSGPLCSKGEKVQALLARVPGGNLAWLRWRPELRGPALQCSFCGAGGCMLPSTSSLASPFLTEPPI